MLDEARREADQLLAVKIMDLIQNEGLFHKPHVFLISLMLATGSSIASLIDSYDASSGSCKGHSHLASTILCRNGCAS